MDGCCTFFLDLFPHHLCLQVDLTEYVEKHEFFFDALLDEDVSNGEVSITSGSSSNNID
jgi:hypothetical protein